ncbi:MAG: penicillin-binding protein 2 [Actinobacteria bacterium]|nr:penicillin-binding protein 2 [Actinomycetota bacterium]
MSPGIRVRIKIITYIALALAITLVLRLYFLQVMSGEIYAEMAAENITREKTVSAPRGNIYDRNGKLLVKSIPVAAVAVEPHMVLKNREVLELLSSYIDMPVEKIEEKIEKSNVSYLDRVILKTGIDKPTMIGLKENSASLPGVEVLDVFLREYRYGVLASHILGYTGEIDEKRLESEKYSGYEGGDQVGLTGLEEYYEYELNGKKGLVTYEVDPLGRPVNLIEEVKPSAGNDLYLTIDIELQKVTEEALYNGILAVREKKIKNTDEYYNVPAGSVVVLDTTNGEVLAMASYPTYDPSIFSGGISEDDWEYLNDPDNYYPLNNRAIQAFPPGSVFKIVTAYAGLAENIISEYSRITCRGTWFGLGKDYPKYCWNKSGHGSLDIRGAIKNSCDSFFYEVGYGLYVKSQNVEELLQKYARLLGFGSATGIDLPSEDSGIVPDRQWKKEYFKDKVEYTVWFPGDTVNMSIGQGDITVSPLQMAVAYLTVANRGIKYTPHLVGEIRDGGGDLVLENSPPVYQEINLNREYVDIMEDGFKLVTSPGGTAASTFSNFPVDEIPIAGKTGTAEFYGRQDFAWFASYGPISSPRYAIIVMLEEAGSGGSNASPIAVEIYRYLFNID